MTVGAAPTYKNVHKTSSEAVTGYTQAASALAYHVDHILSGPTGQLPLPPGVSNESPVEHPQPLALTGGPGVLPNAGSTSDLPMSLYAVSDIDTCYAHDPFTAPTVEWYLPNCVITACWPSCTMKKPVPSQIRTATPAIRPAPMPALFGSGLKEGGWLPPPAPPRPPRPRRPCSRPCRTGLHVKQP